MSVGHRGYRGGAFMGGVGVACQCAFMLYGAEAFIIDVLVHCSPRWVARCCAARPLDGAPPDRGFTAEAITFHNAFILEHGRSMIGSIPAEIAGRFRADVAASPDNSLVVDADFVAAVLMAGADEETIDQAGRRLRWASCFANKSPMQNIQTGLFNGGKLHLILPH